MQTAAHMYRDSYWMRLGLSSAVSAMGASAFVRRSVRELLFEG